MRTASGSRAEVDLLLDLMGITGQVPMPNGAAQALVMVNALFVKLAAFAPANE